MYLVRVIVITLFTFSVPAQAEIIEVEGVASIKPSGVEYARQLAIQAATQQASTQIGLGVISSSKVNLKGALLESSQVRPTVKLGNVKVVRQWENGDNFHVLISTDTAESKTISDIFRKHRKKIVVTPFLARKQNQLNDIDNASSGFSRELLRRLESKNEFLVRNSHEVIGALSTGSSHDTTAVVRFASQYDSQFIVTGEIIDAGNSKDRKRWFEIEFSVLDGLTGSLIARHRIDEFAEGEVTVGNERPFASKSFLSTVYGQAISRTIEAATELISVDLEHLPFTAKVIRLTDGQVYINAGGTSLVAPGDQMVVFHTEPKFSKNSFDSHPNYGITETPVSTLSIFQVQPMFSIGSLSSGDKADSVKTGDLVRFDIPSKGQN